MKMPTVLRITALYIAVKQDNGGRSWLEWEDDFRLRKPEVLEKEKETRG